MRKLLNTLYVMSDNVFLSLDGKNVVLKRDGDVVNRYPLHLFQDIVSFSYMGASPALMGYCAENGIGLAFCKPNGRFLARICGPTVGNVLLRRTQYRVADDESLYCGISRNMIVGKLHNQRQVLERMKRNHAMRIDVGAFDKASGMMAEQIRLAAGCFSADELRGIEGVGAKVYFDRFDDMVLNGKPEFGFHGRSRRPPLDRVNAMLSFGYAVLANECASALESFGLDAYAGFLHRDRPGRKSLALDLEEEFRAPVVDRFVLSLVNNRQVDGSDFLEGDNGAVSLTEDGRKKFIRAWQERKQEIIMHPYLKEKVPWGLLPYVQAQLLARYLRGDLDGYPAFMWR